MTVLERGIGHTPTRTREEDGNATRELRGLISNTSRNGTAVNCKVRSVAQYRRWCVVVIINLQFCFITTTLFAQRGSDIIFICDAVALHSSQGCSSQSFTPARPRSLTSSGAIECLKELEAAYAWTCGHVGIRVECTVHVAEAKAECSLWRIQSVEYIAYN